MGRTENQRQSTKFQKHCRQRVIIGGVQIAYPGPTVHRLVIINFIKTLAQFEKGSVIEIQRIYIFITAFHIGLGIVTSKYGTDFR